MESNPNLMTKTLGKYEIGRTLGTGATGKVKLTFLEKYSRFENHVRDIY